MTPGATGARINSDTELREVLYWIQCTEESGPVPHTKRLAQGTYVASLAQLGSHSDPDILELATDFLSFNIAA